MEFSFRALLDAFTWQIALQLLGGVFILLLSIVVLRILFHAIYSPYLGRFLGHTIDLRKMGQWAVITGATDGIGLKYAEELAKMGINIVLISRTLSKLKSVAESLQKEFKVATKIIDADFSKGMEIYTRIRKELEGLQIGVLINNVGMSYEYPEYLADIPDGDQFVFDIVHCNSISCVMMCRIVLPVMRKRERGVILNVSSASGCLPFPMLSVYGASKTFVNRFSDALQYEYAKFGITVQCVCPFYVSTKLSKMRNNSFWIPTPTQYVQYQLQTIGLERKTYGYSSHRIVGFIGEIFVGSPGIFESIFVNAIYNSFKKGRKAYLRNKERKNKSD